MAVGYYDSSPSDTREYFEDEHPEGLQLLQQIEARKNELLASIESAVWDTGSCGEGGDSYTRFNRSYSDDDISNATATFYETMYGGTPDAGLNTGK